MYVDTETPLELWYVVAAIPFSCTLNLVPPFSVLRYLSDICVCNDPLICMTVRISYIALCAIRRIGSEYKHRSIYWTYLVRG